MACLGHGIIFAADINKLSRLRNDHPMSWWKNFLAREQRTERAQAVARVVITSLVLAYILLIGWRHLDPHVWRQASLFLAIYLVFSVLLYLAIRRWPQPSVARRGFVITSDLSITSWAVHVLGEFGAFLYPLYLWVVVGNGLRFGVPYLFFALGVAVVGFALMIAYTPYWQEHTALAIGLLFGMILLPLFYAALLRELDSTNRELARQVEETAHAATHDALTGLANRYLLRDRLQHDIELARRHGTRVAVLFIDLDGFKEVNDTLGHNGGDALLRLAAQRIEKASRREDTVARYGGDEFVVVLNDLADEREAEVAAARFLDTFAEPIPWAGVNRKITASIGISVFPYDGDDIETLLQRADKAMYMAKEGGGNHFVRHREARA